MTQVQIEINRIEDLRPIDFASGKRLALPRDEMLECECCGRRISKVCHMANGLKVGTECGWYMAAPVYRIGRKNRKAEEILSGVAA